MPTMSKRVYLTNGSTIVDKLSLGLQMGQVAFIFGIDVLIRSDLSDLQCRYKIVKTDPGSPDYSSVEEFMEIDDDVLAMNFKDKSAEATATGVWTEGLTQHLFPVPIPVVKDLHVACLTTKDNMYLAVRVYYTVKFDKKQYNMAWLQAQQRLREN
jgi:hypothetical protein